MLGKKDLKEVATTLIRLLHIYMIAVYGSLIASRIWKNNCSASVATIFATAVGDFSRMFYFNAGFQIIGTIAGLF